MEEQGLTVLSPTAIVFIIVAGLLIFTLPRKHVALPLLIAGGYMTVGQVLMVGSLDFTVHRILLLIAWSRVLVRGEINITPLNALDRTMLVWAFVATVTHTMLVGTMGALINRMGFVYNALGFYFIFRILIVDVEDVMRLGRALAVLMIPLAISMVVEATTRQNWFSVFGGVSSTAAIRDGEIRAQGAFRHPILAGTFGATTIPLVMMLWWKSAAGKWLAVAGVIAALTIVFAPSSSGPELALAVALLGMMMWRFRSSARAMRWLFLLVLVGLQMFMHAPVWFLMNRLGNIFGGHGYHRSLLIDQAVNHLHEWWLVGTTYTAHWLPYSLPINPNMVDITNYYLRMGVDGGLITMGLFIAVIVIAFGTIGRAIRAFDAAEFGFSDKIVVWALGAALLGHAASFLSVSYFDQIVVFWYMLLGAIGSTRDIAIATEAMVAEDEYEDETPEFSTEVA